MPLPAVLLEAPWANGVAGAHLTRGAVLCEGPGPVHWTALGISTAAPVPSGGPWSLSRSLGCWADEDEDDERLWLVADGRFLLERGPHCLPRQRRGP